MSTYNKICFLRLLLAALHYNENSERGQSRNASGDLQFSIHYPRAKSGGFVVRPIKVKATQGKSFSLSIILTLMLYRPDSFTIRLRYVF